MMVTRAVCYVCAVFVRTLFIINTLSCLLPCSVWYPLNVVFALCLILLLFCFFSCFRSRLIAMASIAFAGTASLQALLLRALLFRALPSQALFLQALRSHALLFRALPSQALPSRMILMMIFSVPIENNNKVITVQQASLPRSQPPPAAPQAPYCLAARAPGARRCDALPAFRSAA